jgi:excisionase family DNA binding protein
MATDASLKLTDREVTAAFADSTTAERFPPVLTIGQAAELLQVPKQTVYAWRSQGLLRECSRKLGRHVRFYRDRLIKHVFNHGIHSDE